MPRQSLTKRADGRYRVKYKDQYFYGTTQAEAIQKREEYKHAELEGLRATCPTVSAYAIEWLPAHKKTVAVRTYNAYAGHLDTLCAMYGGYLLSQITPTMIKKVYSDRYEGKSDSHIKKAKMIFSAMFDSAVADGYIRTNPARDKTAKPHKGTEGSHRALTPYEDQIILNVKHPFRPVVMLMRYGGLRRGEALALNVKNDVDFVEGTITIKNAVMYISNQPVLKKPKTDAGIRTVPLFDILRHELENVEGYAAICKRTGGLMSESAFKSAWTSYIRAAESMINNCDKYRWYGKTKHDKQLIAEGHDLPPWKTFDIRPHDLRHSFCTMLRDAGVDLHLAIEWMGHEDEKMILEIYDHINDERRKKAIEMVEKITSRGQNGGQLFSLIMLIHVCISCAR